MSLDVQKLVRDFHLKYDCQVEDRPVALTHEQALNRIRMMGQEFAELQEAYLERDLVKIMDALGDIVYFAYGDAVAQGVDLNAVIAEIHRSNMTKDKGKDAGGKVMKGKSYRAPKILDVIFDQMSIAKGAK